MRAVILDIDGTLVDSNFHHVLAWQQAFADCGELVPASTLCRFIGMGGDKYVAAALGDRWDAEHGDAARERHGVHFRKVSDTVQPLPGAAELVHRAREIGLGVALASSAKQEEVDGHLKVIKCGTDLFDAVVTQKQVEGSKPDPDVFEQALSELDCAPSEAFVVGDTVWDAQAAGRAGLPLVAVLTGGVPAAELRSAGAVMVLDDARDVASRFDEVLAQLSAAAFTRASR